ncbi:MAG: HAD family phosphatase [Bacteroidetes bacterium]|nr:HAD family phosphatase [Bacteroidota bacterium]
MQPSKSKLRIPNSEFSNPNSKFRNLIFDFGGVICNIDVKLTQQAFISLGLKTFDTKKSISASSGLFEKIETGVITTEQFRTELKHFISNPVTDSQIDNAWNALLLDIPASRIRLLEQVRTHYRIFLLSNSNEIHYFKFLENFQQEYRYRDFDALFEKAYFSFNIGLKKPAREIFEFVIEKSNINPAETIFIDDTLVHVEGARQVGIHGYHLKISEGEQITDLFDSNLIKNNLTFA